MATVLLISTASIGSLVEAVRADHWPESDSRPESVALSVWNGTEDGHVAEFLVVLHEQADVSAAPSISDRTARIRYVVDALRATAGRTQRPLRADLDRAGVTYRAFYVTNMVLVQGDRRILRQISGRPEVARVVDNPRVTLLEAAQGTSLVGSSSTDSIAWGVTKIGADDVWAVGFRGEGIVVAGQDTGYDWDHPALVRQYRGFNGVTATHDMHWHDAIHTGGGVCGSDSPSPCDDGDHGTHTMGTIVGDDGAGHQIGVAPGAQWIGCRNMDRGVGTPATYAECFEFFLAPYPIGGDSFIDGDPAYAPHVINNSWTCPPAEGCDWGSLQAVVESVRAAGIFVVASAGNEGPSCSSVADPPAIYDAAFTVAATDRTDAVAPFSSRGPVSVDGSGRHKPDVSAPGVSVYSSVPGGEYKLKSGTSMAGPHVVGTVALLWSADSRLVGDINRTEALITSTALGLMTAQACGGDGPEDVPNNVYGYGRVDVRAALEGVLPCVRVAKSPVIASDASTHWVTYTLSVTNCSVQTLDHVVVTDTVPRETGFVTALGGAWDPIGVVTWEVGSMEPAEVFAAMLVVTGSGLLPGTVIVNDSYGVTTPQLLSPVMGVPVTVTVPWRVLLPMVLRHG
ncbi:MAG: S8 family serine peptidase [Chloroflexi bacterium]|nr:S8 family serine peptidase [Chloroflexota bacterium]